MVKRFVKTASSQDLLDYVGKEALEAILHSIFILIGVKPESKDEVRKHKSVYSRMRMGKLLDALEKNDRDRHDIATMSTCIELQQQILELFLEVWSIR